MFQTINQLELKEILPGIKARFLHAHNFTIAYWEIAKGSVLPMHSHVHEQSSQITSGEFELTIEGETQVCGIGSVALIPSNAKHGGVALSDCTITDVFYPVREDYK